MLSLVFCFGLIIGCTPKDGKNVVNLKVWGSQEDQFMLGEMVDSFKKAYPEKTYKITFGVVGEPDCYARVNEDAAAAGLNTSTCRIGCSRCRCVYVC